MSDNMTREERSKQMALVKNKNTKPEVELKHLFWKLGYHYRYSNWSKLPGKPDLVFVKRKKVVSCRDVFGIAIQAVRIHVYPKAMLNFGKRNFLKMSSMTGRFTNN